MSEIIALATGVKIAVANPWIILRTNKLRASLARK
jgi:hypothetical protein